jgi:predicted RNase H-like HicB family nuclease
MLNQYTAIIVKEGDWFAGTIKELSGCHSQGKTKEEVRANLKEAILLILDANDRHLAEERTEIIEEPITVET